MRVDKVGGVRMNSVQNVEKVQKRAQEQTQQTQRNRPERNRVERSIDRMAKMGNEVKKNTSRMRVFYKALEKSMFDFMG